MSKRDQKKHQKEVKRKQQVKERADRERRSTAGPPREVRYVIAAVRGLIEDREYKKAEELLLMELPRHPRSAELLDETVYLYQKTGDRRSLAKYAPRLAQLRPSDPEANLMMAQGYLFTERVALALQAYRAFLDRWPTHKYASKAEAALELLEPEVGTRLTVFGLTPEELPLLALHDQLLQNINDGEFEAATVNGRSLVAARPKMISARNNLVLALFQMGEFSECLAIARESSDLSPENCFANAQLGLLLFLSGSCEEARVVAQRTLNWAQDHAVTSGAAAQDGLTKLCELQCLLGDDEDVLRTADLAAKLEVLSQDAEGAIAHLRAVALLRLGRKEEALRSWEKCLKLYPHHSLAEENLADAKSATQGHAPWPLSLQHWLPKAFMTKVRSIAATEKKTSSQLAAVLTEWPFLKTLVPAMLDRGDEATREFAIALAKADASPEMMEALKDFALGQRGPDSMRLSLLSFLREHNVIDSTPSKVWRAGRWTEIVTTAFRIHWEPTPHPDKELNNLLRNCYHALMREDKRKALELARKCVERDPNFPACQHNLATALSMQGDRESRQQAQGILDELFDRFPDYVFARVTKVQDAIDGGELERAAQLLEPLTRKEDWHGSEAMSYAAVTALLATAKKDWPGAEHMLGMMRQISPEDPRIEVIQRDLHSAMLKAGDFGALTKKLKSRLMQEM
ncbi:MAG: tetratricopeptide repeat protein [Planctomycetaceae bacterium]